MFREAKGKDDFHGVLDIVVEIVKEDITDASANEHAQEGPGENVFEEIVIEHLEAGFALDAVAGQQISAEKGHQIHEPIPLQTKGSQ